LTCGLGKGASQNVWIQLQKAATGTVFGFGSDFAFGVFLESLSRAFFILAVGKYKKQIVERFESLRHSLSLVVLFCLEFGNA
jgi:hypothetical protein